MQIQTTIITTEQTTSFGVNFQITTFEQTVSAFCDTCSANDEGTETVLENQGWHLGRREQFCPNCNE